jgi:hypothetical protein
VPAVEYKFLGMLRTNAEETRASTLSELSELTTNRAVTNRPVERHPDDERRVSPWRNYQCTPVDPGHVMTNIDFEEATLRAALRDLDHFLLRYQSKCMADVLDVIKAARKRVSDRLVRVQRSKIKAVEQEEVS